MKFQMFKTQQFRKKLTYIAAGILIAAVTLYLVLPIISIFLRITPEMFFETLHDQNVISALWLSLFTTAITLIIVICVGTPFAYFHSRYSYPGKVVVDTLIDLPLVLPPAVAGVALLVLYGRVGLLGQYFNMIGIQIAFTTLAVIMAQVFVASPFYLRQAKSLFEQMDPAYEQTSRTLGASSVRTLFLVTLPMTASGLISGAVMTFGRALGEFGATIMFAGNLPGVTQTMPLAVYVGMQGNVNVGLTISILLVIISFTIMIAVRLIQKREENRA
ncbi:MAG: ABC transporter permease [Methanoregula sp.]|jgi:molybdate transport system permease protein